MKIKRALISVSNKAGVVDLASALVSMGVDIISTGGTAEKIREAGIKVMEISQVTGFPEMLDGRVKTLHPAVHGGLLARRDQPAHMKTIADHDIKPIDLVVVNLYPFRETISKEDVTLEEAIENVDIGGPAMIRSAAKNFEGVAVVVDPEDYSRLLDEMRANNGEVSRETRYQLAAKAFRHTARYDSTIATHLSSTSLEGVKEEFPALLFQLLNRAYTARYGENPHQQAAFYVDPDAPVASLAKAQRLQKADLSFNNLLDLEVALRLLLEFDETAACFVKHANPFGVAVSADSLAVALAKARGADKLAACGAIVGVNRTVDADTAKVIAECEPDALIAPGYEAAAIAFLAQYPNLPILQVDMSHVPQRGLDYKSLTGGMLVQERDVARIDLREAETRTGREPTDEEYRAMRFAWNCVKHVHSSAVVLSKTDWLVGIGAGQMMRMDALRLAGLKAGDNSKGSVLASDGYLSETDCIEEAARLGVTAIVQPGGGPNDDALIASCDKRNIAMIFTGMRHFRH